MNWEAIAAVSTVGFAIGGLLVNLTRMAQKTLTEVKEHRINHQKLERRFKATRRLHGARLAAHEKQLGEHAEQLGEHEVRLDQHQRNLGGELGTCG